MSRDTREFERRANAGRLQVVRSIEAMNADTVKSFGAYPECPKCGGSQLLVKFCTESRRFNPGCEIDGEHLHMGCAACEFMWVTRTLEHAKQRDVDGEVTVDSEGARVLCAMLAHHRGANLPLSLLPHYEGWTIRFHRDFDTGTMVVQAENPKEEPQG